MEKKLYRSSNDKVLAGVCGGIGEYFGVDTVIIRLLWVVFTLMGGAGLIAYIVAAIIVPENPSGVGHIEDNYIRTEDQKNGREQKDSSRNTSIVLGAILLLFGGFVLIRDLIPWIPKDVFLAALLIGLGIFFIVRRK